MRTTVSKRLKVLMLSYRCDGEDVSEARSNYEWTRRLSEHHDVTVLVLSKPDRHGAATSQLPGCRVIEWAEPDFLGRFERFNSLVKPAYALYHLRARRALRELASREHYDLVHQVAPLAPRYPSPATGLGIPLIVGPVGGCIETPLGFRDEVRSMAWYTHLRAVDPLRFRYDPGLRRTYSSADLVLGVAPYMQEILGAIPLRRFEVMSEVGVERLPEPALRSTKEGTLRLLFVGRIVRTKGLRDVIRALAHLRDLERVTLDVIGDGADRSSCEREARELRVRSRVRFHGRLPRGEIDPFYRAADVFVFPSFRETTGNVILEALSFGLPCVTAKRGGPGYAVTDSCGIRISPNTPPQYALEIAGAIRRLVGSPELRRNMGESARERISEEFLWSRKVERMNGFYESVLSEPAGGSTFPRSQILAETLK